jgi:hypothetical protein
MLETYPTLFGKSKPKIIQINKIPPVDKDDIPKTCNDIGESVF